VNIKITVLWNVTPCIYLRVLSKAYTPSVKVLSMVHLWNDTGSNIGPKTGYPQCGNLKFISTFTVYTVAPAKYNSRQARLLPDTIKFIIH